jgi:hypothetical protein
MTKYRINDASGSKEVLALSRNGLKANGTITFSDAQKQIDFEYKPSEGGYDLYVTQSDE